MIVPTQGVNVAKKHQKPTRATMQGGIIDKEMPIHVSNVGDRGATSAAPTRVGYRFDDDGKKVRVCRKCGGTSDGREDAPRPSRATPASRRVTRPRSSRS